MNPQILNVQTGEFNIGNHFIVSNKTKIQELFAYFGEDKVSTENYKNGHSHYTVRDIKIENWHFILTFYFFNTSITRLVFLVSEESHSDGYGWENFNIELEIKKGKYMETWMTHQMNNNYKKYEWGQAGVNYDFHNLSYSCAVNYAPSHTL